jgi:hypothetical protein
VLDPDVVFRASGAPELQQELSGEADVAGKFAGLGPRFATLCHPATVNGHAGLVIKTPEGPAGAIGFTVTDGRITTVDLTLDPDKVGVLGPADDARPSEASGADRILTEALSWPGVYRAEGHFGSITLRVGQHELGHLHEDVVADVPHQGASTWVTVPLRTEEGVQEALALLRANYDRFYD